ncbi:MAG: transglycosylase SLT domain-containing protein [Rickettsia endosymbiont of Bryobia graminum]|nr:transglycosylase SLT domain-containing protein [Rickettsia endosymbiont of Bryobia graminum]
MRLKLSLLFLLLYYTSVNADTEIVESQRCSRMFSYFEAKFQIPRNTLHSIALKESGKKHSKHKIVVVWPWTVNVEGTGHHFSSKKEAISFVKKQIILGKESIDVGCMQINLKHHLDAFESLNEAFNPKDNIAYGAKFLRAKYDQLGSWHKAIAHYHSATHKFGFKYKEDVIKIASNMNLYKTSTRLYNLHNNDKVSPPQLIDKDSFERNSKRYRSSMMVAVPKK